MHGCAFPENPALAILSPVQVGIAPYLVSKQEIPKDEGFQAACRRICVP